MKSVGKAALEMVAEIRRQIKAKPGIKSGKVAPEYDKCITISTKASLSEMIPPGILVMGTPILLGVLFGPKVVAGLLPGAIVSGIQMAISASNTGGAWDNAKKYIEAGLLEVNQRTYSMPLPIGAPKKQGAGEKPMQGGDQEAANHDIHLSLVQTYNATKGDKGINDGIHAAAVIGDTVGDPLKDTSGPSLNILIKLSAIISLVFAKVFDQAFLAKYMNEDTKTVCMPASDHQ